MVFYHNNESNQYKRDVSVHQTQYKPLWNKNSTSSQVNTDLNTEEGSTLFIPQSKHYASTEESMELNQESI